MKFSKGSRSSTIFLSLSLSLICCIIVIDFFCLGVFLPSISLFWGLDSNLHFLYITKNNVATQSTHCGYMPCNFRWIGFCCQTHVAFGPSLADESGIHVTFQGPILGWTFGRTMAIRRITLYRIDLDGRRNTAASSEIYPNKLFGIASTAETRTTATRTGASKHSNT